MKDKIGITNKYSKFIEVWKVPEDFTPDEVNLFAEIGANGVLNIDEAIDCVHGLRN
jgi:hypothetical protein